MGNIEFHTDIEKNSKDIVIEESKKRLSELYGENPSEEILERYNIELKSILNNGFANIYCFCHLICKKAKSDGEIVKIRGCGSCSFIAYLLGISCINPIEYNLDFEIFAGSDFNKMPNFALDFSFNYKNKLLKYIDGYDYKKDKTEMAFYDKLEVLKRLEKITGVNHNEIDIKDTKLIEEIKKNAEGLFEFHNEYIRKIIDKANPQTIDDLVKVSVISHGTGVWEDNYEKLLDEGHNISELLCSREDVFEYLKSKGIDKKTSFEIMDSIAKGKLEHDIEKRNTYVEIMKRHNVENWIIDGFEKIKYMFPKSHGLNIVMMDLWMAWYRINYHKNFILEKFTNIELRIDRM